METQFWIDSWHEGGTKTSFHLPVVHPHARMLAERGLLAGARVLVPLCGKTADMLFFAAQAVSVVGVELVPQAIEEFMADNGVTLVEDPEGVYRKDNLTILNRDVFALSPAEVGEFDLVYDRAALIAFPEEMRPRYVAAMTELAAPGTRYFINTLEYRPALPSPPFSVGPDQIEAYFGGAFDIEHVAKEERPDHRMVEKFTLESLTEHGFLLRRR
ncbi:thiopurine S-methyltransferase [Actinokineospora auranticolor]|uniref:thiopurine S-methyltransferase n=1 Tax=Actinokineospora auranticolor TaxID=155976 RepID=A0A2S6GHM5_9PSEU|nr:thiopurine S-methyltransferase [Actinokineospora auranticolor]PPK64703.1 thiopurine S-methyltransferase [Actinokineospora auranticolor]